MDNEVRQTNDTAFSLLGEEGVSAETTKVRNLLLSLPRACCPAGFEFRLQRRLDVLENGVRPVRERHGWGLGWAGLGLGFAAALLVAVVVFDLRFSPTDIRMPTAPVASSNAPTTGAPMVSSPQQVSPDAGATAAREQLPQMAAAKDTNASKNPPATLPENLFHTVGGNSP